MPTPSKPVAKLEFALVDNWLPWADIHPVRPKLSALSFTIQSDTGILRGRVLNPGSETLNIYVAAILSDGVTTSELVRCVRAGENRAFEFLGAPGVSAGATVKRTLTYPTTIAGVGTTTSPIGC